MFLNVATLISTIIKPGDGVAQTTQAVASTGDQASSTGGFLSSLSPTGAILMYVVIFGAAYFLIIRPQKKREKEMKQMQAALAVGDNVVTSSGMFGTITGAGEDCFIVEFGTNKGVRIPIRKVDIIGKKEPLMSAPKES